MITIETILKSGTGNIYKHEWNYQEVIKHNKDKIFIYDYPILETFKDDFELHICSHFYEREIAFQNIGKFCMYLNERLNNLFPYYNEVLSRIGNYNELFTNLAYDETITRSHDETGTYGSEQDTTLHTTDNQTTNNLVKGRDFPNSAITLDSDKYYTDSSETDASMTDTLNTTNNYNQNDASTKKYEQTENRHFINNSDLNAYEFLMTYRRDIDSIYRDIYRQLDDLFIAVL